MFTIRYQPAGHGAEWRIVDQYRTDSCGTNHIHGFVARRWPVDATQAEIDRRAASGASEAYDLLGKVKAEDPPVGPCDFCRLSHLQQGSGSRRTRLTRKTIR